MAKEIKIGKQTERPIKKTISDVLPVGSVVNGVTKAKSLSEYEYKNKREQIGEETELKRDLPKCTLTESEEKALKEKFVQEKTDKIMDLIQEFSKEYVPGENVDRKGFISERDMIKIAAKLFGIDLDAPRTRREKLEKAFEELTRKKEYVKPECEIVEEGVFPGDFDGICRDLMALHARKNKDYGNAAHESYEEFGLISYVIRLSDKMSRLKSLTKPGAEREVKSESIEDTLMDLAAYAIMAIESLRS